MTIRLQAGLRPGAATLSTAATTQDWCGRYNLGNHGGDADPTAPTCFAGHDPEADRTAIAAAGVAGAQGYVGRAVASDLSRPAFVGMFRT